MSSSGRLVRIEATSSDSQQSTATAPEPPEGYLVPGVLESISDGTIDELASGPEKIAKTIQVHSLLCDVFFNPLSDLNLDHVLIPILEGKMKCALFFVMLLTQVFRRFFENIGKHTNDKKKLVDKIIATSQL